MFTVNDTKRELSRTDSLLTYRGAMSVLGMLEATLPLSPCLDLHTSVGGCHGTGFRGLRLVS